MRESSTLENWGLVRRPSESGTAKSLQSWHIVSYASDGSLFVTAPISSISSDGGHVLAGKWFRLGRPHPDFVSFLRSCAVGDGVFGSAIRRYALSCDFSAHTP